MRKAQVTRLILYDDAPVQLFPRLAVDYVAKAQAAPTAPSHITRICYRLLLGLSLQPVSHQQRESSHPSGPRGLTHVLRDPGNPYFGASRLGYYPTSSSPASGLAKEYLKKMGASL